MKKILYISLLLLFSYVSKAQEFVDKIEGNWIADELYYLDNSEIEINDTYFNTILYFEFDETKVIVYSEGRVKIEVPYTIKEQKLTIGKSVYKIENRNNNQLILSDKTYRYAFLKKDDFLEKHKTIFDNQYFSKNQKDTIYYETPFNRVFTKKHINLRDFLSENVPYYSSYLEKLDQLEFSFIVTKEGIISEILNTNFNDDTFQNELLKALKKTEPQWYNESNKNIIIDFRDAFVYSVMQRNQATDGYINRRNILATSNYKSLYDAENLFMKNKFEKAIPLYINFSKQFKNTKNTPILNLCISYLATNQREKACGCFYQIKHNDPKCTLVIYRYLSKFCKQYPQ